MYKKKNSREYKPQDHAFVICAYQDSPYLEECIRSCLKQTIGGKVFVATSTPNESIRKAAVKYGLPLFVRRLKDAADDPDQDGARGIAADWNYAVSCTDSALVTLAHQDDIYHCRYRERILKAVNQCKHPLIAFTDYCELRDNEIVAVNRLLAVKRLMLSPMLLPGSKGNRIVRRRILSLGSAICCPSVTLVRDNLTEPIFENNMKSNIDWQAWEKISKQQGEFVYVPKPSMLHRIHEDSETSRLIREMERNEEDMMVYRKFWPEPIVRLLEKVYRMAEKSNTL